MAGERLSPFDAQIEILGLMRVLDIPEIKGNVSFDLLEPHDGRTQVTGQLAGIRDAHHVTLLVEGQTIAIPWSKINIASFKAA